MIILFIIIFIIFFIIGWLSCYLLFPKKIIEIDINEKNYSNKIFVDDNSVCYKYQLKEYNSSY